MVFLRHFAIICSEGLRKSQKTVSVTVLRLSANSLTRSYGYIKTHARVRTHTHARARAHTHTKRFLSSKHSSIYFLFFKMEHFLPSQ